MRPLPQLPGAPLRQRGVVLIFALIALAILMIGTVAVIRSMNTAQFSTGNLGFKRDMANQAELAMQRVQQDFTAGTLASPLAREADLPARNYSALKLDTNAQGLPLVLLSDTAFGNVGTVANDITVVGTGITIRYVVDRLSNRYGVCYTDSCIIPASETVPGGSSGDPTSQPVPKALYRLSVRVTGPRNTQSYFQSTFIY